MTYRSAVLRGGAAVVFASLGLAACPGGGGGSDCPNLDGQWTTSGECPALSCEFAQNENSCSITISCSDGTTFNGSVSSSSVSFSDSDRKCTGTLDDIEDDDGDGVIAPKLSGSCMATMGDESCDFDADCGSGDCTVPKEEDDGESGQGGSSGGDSGDGGDSGNDSGAGGFLGGGAGGIGGGESGGVGGDSGEGGVGGEIPAGSGGVGGTGGDGTGVIDPDTCGGCVVDLCNETAVACANASPCSDIVDCAIGSTCSLDDDTCVETACAAAFEGLTLTAEASAALDNIQACVGASCVDECFSGSVPIGGTGGAGGEGGEGGGPALCDDTCEYANDDACDDGSNGDFQYCDLGTDCTDCGAP